jgi:hypothetical protein
MGRLRYVTVPSSPSCGCRSRYEWAHGSAIVGGGTSGFIVTR